MSVAKYPNLEAERVRKGLTRSELADELEISRRTYCGWQTTGKIPKSGVNKLCDYFKLPADYLFGQPAPGVYPTTDST